MIVDHRFLVSLLDDITQVSSNWWFQTHIILVRLDHHPNYWGNKNVPNHQPVIVTDKSFYSHYCLSMMIIIHQLSGDIWSDSMFFWG